MNQRGAVKAVSITSILGVVIALLFLPSFGGFVGAADDGSECGLSGAIVINAELWNPKENASKPDKTIDLALPIEAGTYTVTLVSFDDHSIIDPEQTEERWHVELIGAGNQVVYESDPTSDLEDGPNFKTTTFELEPVKGTATKLRAVHSAKGESIDSIIALCARFTRVEAGRIVVEKVTDPKDSPRRFVFTADYGSFELGHGEQHDSELILAGTHSVSEEAAGGWDTTAICSDGSSLDAIDLEDGETVTCTFTNAETQVDLAVTLDDAPRGEAPKEPTVTPGGPFDYVVNVMNLGSGEAGNVDAVLTISDEVVVDTAALDPACTPAGTDQIVCSVGVVKSGEITRVRVAVRVREDSPGVGTLRSSVIVGDKDFPDESNDPENGDVEPTTFRAGQGTG